MKFYSTSSGEIFSEEELTPITPPALGSRHCDEAWGQICFEVTGIRRAPGESHLDPGSWVLDFKYIDKQGWSKPREVKRGLKESTSFISLDSFLRLSKIGQIVPLASEA